MAAVLNNAEAAALLGRRKTGRSFKASTTDPRALLLFELNEAARLAAAHNSTHSLAGVGGQIVPDFCSCGGGGNGGGAPALESIAESDYEGFENDMLQVSVAEEDSLDGGPKKFFMSRKNTNRFSTRNAEKKNKSRSRGSSFLKRALHLTRSGSLSGGGEGGTSRDGGSSSNSTADSNGGAKNFGDFKVLAAKLRELQRFDSGMSVGSRLDSGINSEAQNSSIYRNSEVFGDDEYDENDCDSKAESGSENQGSNIDQNIYQNGDLHSGFLDHYGLDGPIFGPPTPSNAGLASTNSEGGHSVVSLSGPGPASAQAIATAAAVALVSSSSVAEKSAKSSENSIAEAQNNYSNSNSQTAATMATPQVLTKEEKRKKWEQFRNDPPSAALSTNTRKKRKEELKQSTIRQHYYPEGGWGYVILLVGSLVHLVVQGFHLSFGVLMPSVLHRWGDEYAIQVGVVGSISLFVSNALSPLVIGICRRKSTRLTAVIGGLIMALGCLFTSFASQFHQIYLSYGIFIGVGVCMVRDSATLMVGQYFKRRREILEIPFVASTGLGVAVMSMFMAHSTTTMGWRFGLQAISGLIMSTFFLGTFYRSASLYHPQRRAILHLKTQKRKIKNKDKEKNKIQDDAPPFFEFNTLKSRTVQIILAATAVANFGICNPLFLLAQVAVAEGNSQEAAFNLVFHMGMAWIAGSFAYGLIIVNKNSSECRIARQYLCQSALVINGVANIALTLVKGYSGYLMFSWMYGISYAGFVFTLKMYVFEKVRARNFIRGWGFVQAAMALPNLIGIPLSVAINSSSPNSKHGFYFSAGFVFAAAALFFLIDLHKRRLRTLRRKRRRDLHHTQSFASTTGSLGSTTTTRTTASTVCPMHHSASQVENLNSSVSGSGGQPQPPQQQSRRNSNNLLEQNDPLFLPAQFFEDFESGISRGAVTEPVIPAVPWPPSLASGGSTSNLRKGSWPRLSISDQGSVRDFVSEDLRFLATGLAAASAIGNSPMAFAGNSKTKLSARLSNKIKKHIEMEDVDDGLFDEDLMFQGQDFLQDEEYEEDIMVDGLLHEDEEAIENELTSCGKVENYVMYSEFEQAAERTGDELPSSASAPAGGVHGHHHNCSNCSSNPTKNSGRRRLSGAGALNAAKRVKSWLNKHSKPQVSQRNSEVSNVSAGGSSDACGYHSMTDGGGGGAGDLDMENSVGIKVVVSHAEEDEEDNKVKGDTMV